ncbi:MAG TPA: hypothetical protein VLL48_00150, partial [Longimicrobiales bacterium]|nr:hypothetical protein [Longimicrobiales bacterium]
RNGPDVWEVVMVSRDLGGGWEAVRDHFGGHLTRESLEQALQYADLFPDRIEEMIAENRRVERILSAGSGG